MSKESSHPDPNVRNDSDTGQVIDRLEALDDVIFPALDGDASALHALEPVWNDTVAAVGPAAVAESRWHYLRYAKATLSLLQRHILWQPERILAVLHVIALLAADDV